MRHHFSPAVHPASAKFFTRCVIMVRSKSGKGHSQTQAKANRGDVEGCQTAPTASPADRSEDVLPPTSERKYRCVFCGNVVSRRDCHRNRYGEYVCLACFAQGKRWSAKTLLQRAMRRFL